MKHSLYVGLLVVIGCLCGFVQAETKIVNPRINDRIEPVGANMDRIVFSWNLSDEHQDTRQTEYRITVLNISHSGNIWDSGWVQSNQCIEIPYAGKELASSTRYSWTVQVKNNRGEISQLEKPASFITGILSRYEFTRNEAGASVLNRNTGWKAKWISMDQTDKGPLPIFRKSFEIDKNKKIETAVVHICGLGHFELNLNGQKIGNNFIDPGWTNYKKTCLYVSFDLTDSLKSGENVFGVLLGNGMYNVPGGRYVKFTGSFGPPKMICELHVKYSDGTEQVVCSDETWKSSLGPIVFSCVYGGEDVDNRRIENDWDKPGFTEGENWKNAVISDWPQYTIPDAINNGKPESRIVYTKLSPQEAPPITVTETKKPEKLERLPDGRYRADFGYNFSGRPRVVLKGKAGQSATVKTAEILDRIWEEHSYKIILNGEGEELLLPKFTYFGFQFLYIDGAVLEKDRTDADADKPTLVSFEADFTTSSAEKVGSFECSDALFNDIDKMVDRSVRSNLASVLTDCPHREKLGWLEVPHLMGPSIMGRYGVHNLYRKICQDTTESQLTEGPQSGLVPDISPEYTRFEAGFFDTAEWGSACVQIPWLLFQVYGDADILKRQKDTMVKYVDYLDSTRKENDKGLVKAGLGDWYDWSEEKGHAGYSQHTPGELTATAIFIDDIRILKKISRGDEIKKWDMMLGSAVNDFHVFHNTEKNTVSTGSQSACAEAFFALGFDELPKAEIAVNHIALWLLSNLVRKIEADQFKPTVGEVSHIRLIRALASGGFNDILWKMFHRTDKPGYGYMLREKGMKTLSETWDGPGSSMNHCMFGHVQEWFTGTIVGINIRKSEMRHARFVLNPTPVGDLTWAKGHYDSVYGRVESSWEIKDGRFKYRCVIPANTEAIITLPPESREKEKTRTLGSGTYEFN